MFKLIFGLLIVGSIFVIVQEYRKAKKKEEVAADLQDELETVNTELFKADVEEDVVDAKVVLKERKAAIRKKAEVLNTDATLVAAKKKAAKKASKK